MSPRTKPAQRAPEPCTTAHLRLASGLSCQPSRQRATEVTVAFRAVVQTY
jgi:hypothetical protein